MLRRINFVLFNLDCELYILMEACIAQALAKRSVAIRYTNRNSYTSQNSNVL